MTKVALETVDAVRRRLAVEIPAGDVTAEIDRAYEQLRRKAHVPGFRQGRAPRAVLERMFGDQVRADVFGRLVSESYADAIREQNIHPVAQPEIVTEHAAIGEPLRYSATVEIRPSVVVQGYTGLAVDRPVRTVTDTEVDAFIDRLRHNNAELVPITDRATAVAGDIAVIDYEAQIGGRRVGHGEQRLVEVGTGEGPGARLDGVAVGEPTSFELEYPADYGNAELAGQTVAFRVTVHALRRRELPPLDDVFANAVAECASVAALRDRIREQLTMGAERDANAAVRAAVIERLVTAHDFAVPDAMIERRADALSEEVLEGLGARRPPVSREADVRARLRSELHDRARDQVKATLLLEAIAAQEHLTVDDAEVEARIDQLAESAGKSRERVRALYRDASVRAGLHARMLQERALDFVVQRASVRDVAAGSGVAGVAGNG
jgi:trigger factor